MQLTLRGYVREAELFKDDAEPGCCEARCRRKAGRRGQPMDQWPSTSRLETTRVRRGKKAFANETLGGASAWTKRNKGSGEFMALKRPGKKKKAAKKFKGVRTEKAAFKKRTAKKKTGVETRTRDAVARVSRVSRMPCSFR